VNASAETTLEDVDVVIVAYNSGAVIADAISPLAGEANVIVVDNASSDDSVAVAEALGATVLRSETNEGFGAACNLGAAVGRCAFVLFLNPDARIAPDALRQLRATLASRPRWAAAAPRISDAAGREFFRAHTELDGDAARMDAPDGVGEVSVLSGCALLCRREAFEAVGGFDEDIFLYYEDDDLCVRWRSAGWSVGVDRTVGAIHLHAASTSPSAASEEFKAYHRQKARQYVYAKHGLSADWAKDGRKSLVRGVLRAAFFDRKRSARAFGRLRAIREAKLES